MGRDEVGDDTAGRGTAMVEHVLDVVGQRSQPVLVLAAPGQPLPALRVRVLRDEARGLGALAATGRGLRAARDTGAQRAFVCAIDVSFLTVDVIDALAGQAAEVDADVVLPWDGRDHYLAAVYRTDLAERIDALVTAGKRSMRALVDSVDAQRVVMPDLRAFTNVNSEPDLRALVQPGQ